MRKRDEKIIKIVRRDQDWFEESDHLTVYQTDNEIIVKANVAGVPAEKVTKVIQIANTSEYLQMNNLTDRQIRILKAIIEEYINSAQPVGSETLEKKYQLSVSPATIRNEMVELINLGYLKKPHKSAGRVPTPMALKYYVVQLLEPEPMPVSEEVSVKEKIWNVRHEKQKLIEEAVRTLAISSNALALATTDDGNLFYAGSANILDYPEFFDIDLTKAVLAHLDRSSFWYDLYHQAHGDEPFYLILGEEFPTEIFFPCSFLYTHFKTNTISGAIGIVGPYRLQYRRLVPMITYFGELLNELGQ